MSFIFLIIAIFTVPVGVMFFNMRTAVSQAIPTIENYNVSFEDITYDELNYYVELEDDFVVVFYQTGCYHCDEFLPVYEDVIGSYENNIPSYKLNIAELSDEEYYEFNDTYSVNGTPTTVYFEDGVEFDRVVGNIGESTLTTTLESWDVIDEY